MSKDRCPYNSFFGEKVMIKEKLSLIWGKFVNRETISYLIFGVLTTLVDWISYAVFRHNGMNYRMATICCQAAAILFAYVTNKIWVFRSYNFHPVYLLKEMASFFSCRILSTIIPRAPLPERGFIRAVGSAPTKSVLPPSVRSMVRLMRLMR